MSRADTWQTQYGSSGRETRRSPEALGNNRIIWSDLFASPRHTGRRPGIRCAAGESVAQLREGELEVQRAGCEDQRQAGSRRLGSDTAEEDMRPLASDVRARPDGIRLFSMLSRHTRRSPHGTRSRRRSSRSWFTSQHDLSHRSAAGPFRGDAGQVLCDRHSR
jgi:hypothetical protein